MSNIFNDAVDSKRILRELVILRQLKHPLVVKLMDVFVSASRNSNDGKEYADFNEVYMVLEFGESDLKKLLKSSLTLEMVHIQTILWNLLHAIKYIHESKVLHRDLKPANVLINEDCTIKICDFGLSRSFNGIGN